MFVSNFFKWFVVAVAVFAIAACAGDGLDKGTDTSGTVGLDTTAPVITLNGNSVVTLFQGEAYTEQGATASDDVAIIVNVVITGSVDTASLGDYIIT